MRVGDGPRLALLAAVASIALLGLILTAGLTDGVPRGAAIAILGIGILAARREVAEVFRGLNWPKASGLSLDVLLTCVLGLALVGAGIYEALN